MRPFIAAMDADEIFMDDNARPHRARLVRSYLESETIPQMAWPARSPDLNPIEHVWGMLGRRMAGRSVPPGTLHELQQALLQEWALLPQHAINDTIAFQLEGIVAKGLSVVYDVDSPTSRIMENEGLFTNMQENT
ncbi:hypothetical protein AVEN_47844-1 [Araneus ventricosus]|uniref:Tc1-like transposase DDE domain-containing protein n=1 Tax=Araneus ventricosus TaxID=182803 RepID=A0A4Y2QBQ5_ARAVE|nr:hypothetical protein AVEN_47844-1 [Araneus ventricosus]